MEDLWEEYSKSFMQQGGLQSFVDKYGENAFELLDDFERTFERLGHNWHNVVFDHPASFTTLKNNLHEATIITGSQCWSTLASIIGHLGCAEHSISLKQQTPIVYTERSLQRKISNSLKKYFPELDLLGVEKYVPSGRIDIYARETATGRDCLIELKVCRVNPTFQLLSYANHFQESRLIALCDSEVAPERRAIGIEYWIYEDDNVRRYS